ncbi:PTS fructose transporter subunit IIB [Oceanobacillus indicireducens]|uniref:PTS fructose transporter subunit IIB n=1 Tax=Oceanobacillus indicireducens TaxID=1004261 RepID=A0A917Y034_9BACI|nr:fructose PTS transporter subunit IIB [Oceanobacillus indicireducens]GGN59947.1 PTS fructose transporter subunit IIB [Oceanobacillus indicireducens]
MKFVEVAAYTAGIAHTYLAKEKLVKAAQEAGYIVIIETQRKIGTEDELTTKEITDADVVIIATDISISGRERFKDKKVIWIPTHIAMKSPKALVKNIEMELNAATK